MPTEQQARRVARLLKALKYYAEGCDGDTCVWRRGEVCVMRAERCGYVAAKALERDGQ